MMGSNGRFTPSTTGLLLDKWTSLLRHLQASPAWLPFLSKGLNLCNLLDRRLKFYLFQEIFPEEQSFQSRFSIRSYSLGHMSHRVSVWAMCAVM